MTIGNPARSIVGLLLALLTLVAGCAYTPPPPDRPPPRPTPSTTPEREDAPRPASPGELPTRIPIVEPAPLFALYGGELPGYPTSHGRIRLPHAFAEVLSGITDFSTTEVVVVDRPGAGERIG